MENFPKIQMKKKNQTNKTEQNLSKVEMELRKNSK